MADEAAATSAKELENRSRECAQKRLMNATKPTQARGSFPLSYSIIILSYPTIQPSIQ